MFRFIIWDSTPYCPMPSASKTSQHQSHSGAVSSYTSGPSGGLCLCMVHVGDQHCNAVGAPGVVLLFGFALRAHTPWRPSTWSVCFGFWFHFFTCLGFINGVSSSQQSVGVVSTVICLGFLGFRFGFAWASLFDPASTTYEPLVWGAVAWISSRFKPF